MLLADVAHVERDLAHVIATRGTPVEHVEELRERRVHLVLRAVSQVDDARPRGHLGERGAEQPPRGEVARVRGDYDLADLQLAGEQRGKKRTCAAERHQRRLTRVLAALDRDPADRVRHVRGGDRHDPAGRVLATEAELLRKRREGCLRLLAVEHDSARQLAVTEHSEQERGVGDGRLGPAPSVAGRAGDGAGAARADPHQAADVDVSDRPAAGADRAHVDPRCLHRQALHLALVHQLRLPVDDEARVETRSADVCGDHVAEVEDAGELARALGACDRPGHDRLERAHLGLSEGHRTASRPRHNRRALEAGAAKAIVERL